MYWKSVVWVVCLSPLLTGCGALRQWASRAPGQPTQVDPQVVSAQPPARVPAAPRTASRQSFGASAEERTVPPLPKPELPVIKPLNPPSLDVGAKFGSLALPEPNLLPVPNPPLPISIAVPPPSGLELPPAVPAPATRSTVPTILDDIPPIPFQLPAAGGAP